MWSDWLVFCNYGFSVSALWCPLATPWILLGFLLPWTWGISSRLLQQSAAAAPYFGRGVSPHSRPSWPWTWSSSSRPSCTGAATAPWTWGSSSRLPPLTSGWGSSSRHASAWSVAARLGQKEKKINIKWSYVLNILFRILTLEYNTWFCPVAYPLSRVYFIVPVKK